LQQLLAHFVKKGVPAHQVTQIAEAFVPKQYERGSYFTEEGKTSRYLAFISKGFFQYYYLKDGKEITTYITGENTFLASVSSFFKQQPSREFVRALTDAEVWVISHANLMVLKRENDAFKSFYIDALEMVVAGIDESRSNLITLTAEERYTLLLKEEPKLLQQIPLQYLASILGITPRHLSRIRNNI